VGSHTHLEGGRQSLLSKLLEEIAPDDAMRNSFPIHLQISEWQSPDVSLLPILCLFQVLQRCFDIFLQIPHIESVFRIHLFQHICKKGRKRSMKDLVCWRLSSDPVFCVPTCKTV